MTDKQQQPLTVADIDAQLSQLAQQNTALTLRQAEIETAIADTWQQGSDTAVLDSEYAQNALKLKSAEIVKARLLEQRQQAVQSDLFVAYESAIVAHYAAEQTSDGLQATVKAIEDQLEQAKTAFQTFMQHDVTALNIRQLESRFEALGVDRATVQAAYTKTWQAQQTAAAPADGRKRKAG